MELWNNGIPNCDNESSHWMVDGTVVTLKMVEYGIVVSSRKKMLYLDLGTMAYNSRTAPVRQWLSGSFYLE
jgi:hypothetical protein